MFVEDAEDLIVESLVHTDAICHLLDGLNEREEERERAEQWMIQQP